MGRLKDKRALITGGTTGIGLETARQFINEGARVAITGRDPGNLKAAQKELGESVLVIPSDASDVKAQKEVAESLRQSFGGLDILFANAGIADADERAIVGGVGSDGDRDTPAASGELDRIPHQVAHQLSQSRRVACQRS